MKVSKLIIKWKLVLKEESNFIKRQVKQAMILIFFLEKILRIRIYKIMRKEGKYQAIGYKFNKNEWKSIYI